MFKDGKLHFKESTRVEKSPKKEKFWNILIVDDEEGIHEVSKLALGNFEFEKRKCNFISAYSAQEAKEIVKNTPNIALALVDVVMESDHAGLELISYIRNELGNQLIRLILRTGQPGQAPEERVINEYDINDYKDKSELTSQKLYTAVLTSLRAYRDMSTINKNRQGLKKIIQATSSIEKMFSTENFLNAMLEQLISILDLGDYDDDISCFVAAVSDHNFFYIAGSGKYKSMEKNTIYSDKKEIIHPLIKEVFTDGCQEINQDDFYILYIPTKLEYSGFILYIDTNEPIEEQDKDMIKLFLDKITTAYENSTLSKELEESHREIIFTISEIAEQRSKETGKHVKRVALYSQLLAKAYGLPEKELEIIYIASSMHDIGKMGTPDNILKKPGLLSDDEMTIMKEHSSLGHKMLHTSKHDIMKVSSVIAKEHHEKFDGSGYPSALKGEEINLYARIVALADVFDALCSKRIYKEAWEMDRVLEHIRSEKGKHFDPKLVDLFFENLDEILKIQSEYRD